MALSGLHVVCCPIVQSRGASLLARPYWSQTMATAGTTTEAAPNDAGVSFEIFSSVDAFVATGATPDATGSKRYFVPAGQPKNVLCFAGDKLAWVAA